jgi:hypothetical protein
LTQVKYQRNLFISGALLREIPAGKSGVALKSGEETKSDKVRDLSGPVVL